ncbi:homoserine dehydrogenase [Rhizobium sp. EC-SD404]|uniref:homoserine dehydrogenase n=1 Tax=Rhizobium sp. EC-SD404 TaxID=2038389 RepID=UPI00125B3722|nr:homoserine dehydrogenase [Rhizobium sp. EC-SD404]VVS97243.1 Homoserine dehydrogenase, NAD binding domain protein [Rhizobium sp. EC-SD404]
MRVVKVAIAGLGGVGRATAELLLSRRGRYREVYATDVRLAAACGSRSGRADPDGLEASDLDALEDGRTGPDFIAASGADILIEAGPSDFRTGGPGLVYIHASLSAGLDTIVVSKGALVHSGSALRQLAKSTGATLKLSGAAASALPTIDLLEHSLKGCRVVRVEGILNATTNYLLDAMTTRGIDFHEALRQAQAGGFAEANPSNDVDGWDTAAKLVLIANFGLGADLTMEDVQVEGIGSVTMDRVQAWRADGVVPKLVGELSWPDGLLRATVGIRTYPTKDPLSQVGGKDKAIRILTEEMGETIAIASGKEPMATAAAALKDLESLLAMRAAGPSSD